MFPHTTIKECEKCKAVFKKSEGCVTYGSFPCPKCGGELQIIGQYPFQGSSSESIEERLHGKELKGLSKIMTKILMRKNTH